MIINKSIEILLKIKFSAFSFENFVKKISASRLLGTTLYLQESKLGYV